MQRIKANTRAARLRRPEEVRVRRPAGRVERQRMVGTPVHTEASAFQKGGGGVRGVCSLSWHTRIAFLHYGQRSDLAVAVSGAVRRRGNLRDVRHLLLHHDARHGVGVVERAVVHGGDDDGGVGGAAHDRRGLVGLGAAQHVERVAGAEALHAEAHDDGGEGAERDERAHEARHGVEVASEARVVVLRAAEARLDVAGDGGDDGGALVVEEVEGAEGGRELRERRRLEAHEARRGALRGRRDVAVVGERGDDVEEGVEVAHGDHRVLREVDAGDARRVHVGVVARGRDALVRRLARGLVVAAEVGLVLRDVGARALLEGLEARLHGGDGAQAVDRGLPLDHRDRDGIVRGAHEVRRHGGDVLRGLDEGRRGRVEAHGDHHEAHELAQVRQREHRGGDQDEEAARRDDVRDDVAAEEVVRLGALDVVQHVVELAAVLGPAGRHGLRRLGQARRREAGSRQRAVGRERGGAGRGSGEVSGERVDGGADGAHGAEHAVVQLRVAREEHDRDRDRGDEDGEEEALDAVDRAVLVERERAA
mmetsp:Transcript_7705/g.24062  ORF Transcript_7705/g.24062 Transcript_7705/m.24062 type:complete len:536 (-) Transcript_7705:470-2077(-)